MVQRGMEIIALVLGAAALALIFAPELVIAQFSMEPSAGRSWWGNCTAARSSESP